MAKQRVKEKVKFIFYKDPVGDEGDFYAMATTEEVKKLFGTSVVRQITNEIETEEMWIR